MENVSQEKSHIAFDYNMTVYSPWLIVFKGYKARG